MFAVVNKKRNFVKHVVFHACALLLICMLPAESAVVKKSGMSGGGSFDGAQNSSIRRLMTEKQQKMEKLEQCAKKVSGFKIAGISTLGLTAAGVAGNVVLANKKKGLETELESTQKKIESEEKKQSEIQSKIAAEEKRIAEENCKKDSSKKWENGKCIPKVDPTQTAPVVSNGQIQQVANSVLSQEECEKDETKQWQDGKCIEKTGNVETPPVLTQEECEKDETKQWKDGACVDKEENTQNSGLVYEGVLGGQCAAETKKKMHIDQGVYVKANSNKDCLDKKTNTVIKCECQATSCVSDDYELKAGMCKKADNTKTEECIKEMDKLIGLDASNRLVLKVADRRILSESEKKEDLQVSTWLYKNDDKTEEQEKNACDTLAKLKAYVAKREGFMKNPIGAQCCECDTHPTCKKYFSGQCKCDKDKSQVNVSGIMKQFVSSHPELKCSWDEYADYIAKNVAAVSCYCDSCNSDTDRYKEIRSKWERTGK